MGKTQKPLSILVTDIDLYNSAEIKDLIAKGHTVQPPNKYEDDFDIIIGRRCWRIIPTMGKLSTYLDLMLAGVRNVKYPKVS